MKWEEREKGAVLGIAFTAACKPLGYARVSYDHEERRLTVSGDNGHHSVDLIQILNDLARYLPVAGAEG